MKNDIVISVQNLSKSYKMYRSPTDRIKEFLHPGKKSFHQKFWALREVSFDIEKGTTFGIIGQNGSGKSTLLQLISGIIRPTNGSVTVNGRISALLELGAGFHRDFSGRENVFMQGALMGIDRKEMEKNFDSIQEFADIGEFIDQPVKTYSSGMYVRLAFATAVNIDPDILIIDEVLAVGDDMFRRRCFRRLEEFQEKGKTVLFVSHSLPTVTNICSNSLLLDKGELVEIGNPKHISNIYSKLISEREEKYLKRISDLNISKTSTQKLSYDRVEESQAESDSEFRYGAGGAELIDIELLNHKKEKVNILEHGEEFTIRIQALFKKQMKEPTIGFRIRTLTGVDIFGTNTTLSNRSIGKLEPGSKITVEFNQIMRINKGSYTLTSGIGEEISKQLVFHDRRMDVIVFKVIGDGQSGGLVDLGTSVHFTKHQA
jgi:ABC-type polysaccharide/polyol phosphate transport system ATPase subunit